MKSPIMATALVCLFVAADVAFKKTVQNDGPRLAHKLRPIACPRGLKFRSASVYLFASFICKPSFKWANLSSEAES